MAPPFGSAAERSRRAVRDRLDDPDAVDVLRRLLHRHDSVLDARTDQNAIADVLRLRAHRLPGGRADDRALARSRLARVALPEIEDVALAVLALCEATVERR